MITFNQLMIYVNDPEKAANFWIDNLGFALKETTKHEYVYTFTISDKRANGTEIVFQDKEFVKSLNSGVNLETPSILLETDEDIEELYQKLKSNNVNVGDMVRFPDTDKRVFNFSDEEDNYFAITEK